MSLGIDEAKTIINAWSESAKQYLWPLCDHATITGLREVGAHRFEMDALVEGRQRRDLVKTVPEAPNKHLQKKGILTRLLRPEPCFDPGMLANAIRSFDSDPWDIPFDEPAGFAARTDSWTAAHPSCIGKCAKCQCVGTVTCPTCDGKGRQHGEAKAKCEQCEGLGKRQCDVCGGTGWVASYPHVVRSLRLVTKRVHFHHDATLETGVKLNEHKAVWTGESSVEKRTVPPVPEGVPEEARAGLSRQLTQFVADLPERVWRTRVRVGCVPVSEVQMNYCQHRFTLHIAGKERTIVVQGWVPPNRRRGVGLWIGIPSLIAFVGAVIASVVLAANEVVTGGSGALLIIVSVVLLLGVIAFLRWSILSKPAPKKRGQISPKLPEPDNRSERKHRKTRPLLDLVE
jgi:hypothetical protein